MSNKNLKTGDKVVYTYIGASYLSDYEEERCAIMLKVMEITDVLEVDGITVYKVENDSAMLCHDEIEKYIPE